MYLRDLAEQTHKCFEAYSKYLAAPALSSVLLVGGLDAGAQLRALQAGAEIVVGTPGRLIDFVETGKLPLDKASGYIYVVCAGLSSSKPGAHQNVPVASVTAWIAVPSVFILGQTLAVLGAQAG